MQRVLWLIIVAVSGGCAAHHAAPASMPAPVAAAEPEYLYPASALVFEPPIAAGIPAMDLSRDAREPMAFAGFQQAQTAYTYVRTDDRQNSDWHNGYDRRSITVQIGTSTR